MIRFWSCYWATGWFGCNHKKEPHNACPTCPSTTGWAFGTELLLITTTDMQCSTKHHKSYLVQLPVEWDLTQKPFLGGLPATLIKVSHLFNSLMRAREDVYMCLPLIWSTDCGFRAPRTHEWGQTWLLCCYWFAESCSDFSIKRFFL